MTDAPPRIPRATYRLQLGSQFTFSDAARLLPYLNRLGISHLYVSPFLEARSGSTHGYDITDYGKLNPEIGSQKDFDDLAGALRERGMGQILDFVPNHMGIAKADNEWWLDVLEWGQASPYANFFDIDWRPAKPELWGKVLLPFLGDQYGKVLESGELSLAFDETRGSFGVWYHEHLFPVGPAHYWYVLASRLSAERNAGNRETAGILEDLITRSRALRAGGASRRRRAALREQGIRLKEDLAELVRNNAEMRAIVARAVDHFTGEPGQPRSFTPLHRLLERQAYRLAYWRVAADEINYRRFFDINELAGVRMERPDLFEVSHRLIRDLVGRGALHGLRIDHIDGLFDPAAYCRDVARHIRRRTSEGEEAVYLVVEKILAADEPLRRAWPIDGTTGYEVLNEINGLYVAQEGRRPLDRIYRRFTGETAPYAKILHDSKTHVIEHLLSSELQVLANELDRISESNWRSRDFTLQGLRAILEEITACYPVYRSYVDQRGATLDDREVIDAAVSAARRRTRGRAGGIFDFVHRVLTADLVGRRGSGYSRSKLLRFVMKYQQYTGPVMAKSMEDTCFYRFNRLISLNEVGGEPDRMGISTESFHEKNGTRMHDWPHSMVTLSTHDGKRGEDARARINVLSELPEEWGRRISRWSRLNRRGRTQRGRHAPPSRNDEYFLYQTLVGSWPNQMLGGESLSREALEDFGNRVQVSMVKAVREAKLNSSWAEPDEAYEDALCRFVERILDPARGRPFLEDFVSFEADVAWFGMLNALSQTVLKFTIPGVPDTYQGSELWNYAMVDPDNRRPVDFDRRMLLLEKLERDFPTEAEADPAMLVSLVENWRDGRIKLLISWRLLQLRRSMPELFENGGYLPLRISGEKADHLCAFARTFREVEVIVVAPRNFAGLVAPGDLPGAGHWGDTAIAVPPHLQSGEWRDALTGRAHSTEPATGDGLALAAARLLDILPVSVLASNGSAADAAA